MADRISGARSEATETMPDLWPQNLRKTASTSSVCFDLHGITPTNLLNLSTTTKEHVSPPIPILVLEMTWSHAIRSRGAVGSSMSLMSRRWARSLALRLWGASYSFACKQVGHFLDLGKCVRQWLASTASSVQTSSSSEPPLPTSAISTACETSGL